MNKLKEKNYIDITKEWLNKPKSKKYKVKEQLYFDYNHKRYHVDNKNVILDYNQKELEIAKWLVKIFGGKIYMLPRINKPDGIKTPDYLWNNEYWDLKEIKSSGTRAVDNRINGTKSQTSNYILDFSKNVLTNKEIVKKVANIYNSPERNWVNKIIIIKDNKLLKVLKRKD